jgi:hypothetical protein
MAHQRPAGGLGAGERLELRAERRELGVDVVDHAQRDLDLPPRRRGELEVRTGGHHRRLTVGDRHVPETLRRLVDQLTELARERRRGESLALRRCRDWRHSADLSCVVS